MKRGLKSKKNLARKPDLISTMLAIKAISDKPYLHSLC